MKAHLALLLLAVGLCSCARDANSPPAGATGDSSGSPAAPAPAAPAQSGSSSGQVDLATAAKIQEGADTGTTTDSSSAALERIAALPAAGQLPPGPWVAGKNYEVLSPAQPTEVEPGKVEVIEMFWYACPHCYALDPTVESWRKGKPAYIDFKRVPVTWGEEHRAHARLFYTLKALGKLDQLQGKVFDQIQQKGDLLFVPGDEKGTLQKQLQFATANGISESDFMNAYGSLSVKTAVDHADDLVRRYRIDSVPTFVINGKYVSDAEQAGSSAKLMHLIDDLAANEKRH